MSLIIGCSQSNNNSVSKKKLIQKSKKELKDTLKLNNPIELVSIWKIDSVYENINGNLKLIDDLSEQKNIKGVNFRYSGKSFSFEAHDRVEFHTPDNLFWNVVNDTIYFINQENKIIETRYKYILNRNTLILYYKNYRKHKLLIYYLSKYITKRQKIINKYN